MLRTTNCLSSSITNCLKKQFHHKLLKGICYKDGGYILEPLDWRVGQSRFSYHSKVADQDVNLPTKSIHHKLLKQKNHQKSLEPLDWGGRPEQVFIPLKGGRSRC